MSVKVKICGINDRKALSTAIRAGADYLGFVFYEKSPRHLSWCDAGELVTGIPPNIKKVALVVNAGDDELERIIKLINPDILQLHGSQNIERVKEIAGNFGLPVWKAVQIGGEEDFEIVRGFEAVADRILLDARPPKNMPGALPGGNALSFDWKLLARAAIRQNFVLAGGLTPENVKDAIAMTGAKTVDVSSGVESAPGFKDAGLIEEFIKAVKSIEL